MKNYLIVPNLTREKTERILPPAKEILEGLGAGYTVSPDGTYPEGAVFDALIFIGGDGTMLRSAHTALELGIPMVGINAGSLGYYSRISEEDLEKKFAMLVRDEFATEECVLLTHDGKKAIVNDAVAMVKGSVASFMVIRRDGREIMRTISSGIIVSTSIGSSGITKSAGGALIENGLGVFEITPVLANRGDDRSLVVDSGSEITVSFDRETEIKFDGVPEDIRESSVSFREFDRKLQLIRF